MKKSIFFAALAATLAFTACNSETEPVLQTVNKDTTFTLNTPVLADQYLQLVKGGSTEFICSQPDYGVAVSSRYALQVSADPNFATYKTITPATPSSTTIVVDDNTLAAEICQLLYTDEEGELCTEDEFNASYDGKPIPLYFRAECWIPVNNETRVPDTTIYSNVVELTQVVYYYATLDPGWIYLVGSISDWKAPEEGNAAHYENYKVMETGYQTGIYQGTFTFPAAPQFRFYQTLGGWGNDGELPSIGYQEADGDTDFAFDNGYYSSAFVFGKGNWCFPDFPGGDIQLTVNWNKMTVEFQVVE